MVLLVCCMLLMSGCHTWIRYTKKFGGDTWYPHEVTLREWDIKVYVNADLPGHSKEDLERELGHSPELVSDYDLFLELTNIVEIDTSLSMEELRDIRLDSARITFNGFTKTFIAKTIRSNFHAENKVVNEKNDFEHNLRSTDGGRLHFPESFVQITLGRLHIPPGIEAIDVTIYGLTRNRKSGIQPFEISMHLPYFEESRKVIQLMD